MLLAFRLQEGGFGFRSLELRLRVLGFRGFGAPGSSEPGCFRSLGSGPVFWEDGSEAFGSVLDGFYGGPNLAHQVLCNFATENCWDVGRDLGCLWAFSVCAFA